MSDGRQSFQVVGDGVVDAFACATPKMAVMIWMMNHGEEAARRCREVLLRVYDISDPINPPAAPTLWVGSGSVRYDFEATRVSDLTGEGVSGE